MQITYYNIISIRDTVYYDNTHSELNIIIRIYTLDLENWL